MSFEGYYQVKCDNNHYYTTDAYNYSNGEPCETCKAPTYGHLVDDTNGEAEGYDPNFSEGCNVLMSVWSSDIAEMRGHVKELIELYRGLRYTREVRPGDTRVDEIEKRYELVIDDKFVP